MAGALTSIIAAVSSYLPAGTNVFTGADALRQESAPPRVVFVPANEDWTSDTGGVGDPAAGTPAPIAVRLANVEIHVWGADIDGTEALMHSVVQALNAAAVGSVRLASGQWVTTGGADVSGMAYVLTAQFKIPVTRPAETWAPWNNAPTTAELDFTDGTVYSVPVTSQ